MMQTNPKVDAILSKTKQWQKEFEALRSIALGCQLTEELKWGQACYTYEKRNIVLMHGFKEYCALLFFKGALLNDPQGILVQQTANVQAARQIRFTQVREIVKLKAVLKAYIAEAIAVEKSGMKVAMKQTAEFAVPAELKARFAKDPDLKKAFATLTPGRQRAYLLYFAAAKQPKTREARIEKYAEQILEGRGLND